MPDLSADDLDLLTTVAKRHATQLEQLREALEAEDTAEALRLAKQIVGLADVEPL